MSRCVVEQLAQEVARLIPEIDRDETAGAAIVEIEETALHLRAKSREGAIFQYLLLGVHVDDIFSRVDESSEECRAVDAKFAALKTMLNSIGNVVFTYPVTPTERTLRDYYRLQLET